MLPNDIFNKKNCIDLIFTRNSVNVLIMSFFSVRNILENSHAVWECSKCQIQLSSIPWTPQLDSESIYCTIHLTSSTLNTNNIYERVTDSKKVKLVKPINITSSIIEGEFCMSMTPSGMTHWCKFALGRISFGISFGIQTTIPSVRHEM